MLYWFFVKGLGPIAIHRLGPTTKGLENIPREVAADQPTHDSLHGQSRIFRR